MEGEKPRSVWVEVETPTDAEPAPAARPDGKRSGENSVVIIGGLLLFVALLLAVRPTGSESADGSTRTAPTTVAPSTTGLDPTAEGPSDSAGIDEVEDEPLHRKVEGIFGEGLSSVVRADVGYLASTWHGGNNSAALYRSLDGVEWTAVDAVFPEELERSRQRGFSLSHLRRTATGYSALASFFVDGENTVSNLLRLVSADGKVWAAHSPVAPSPETLHAFPVLHSDSMWAYITIGDNSLTAELLDAHLVDPGMLAGFGPCWLNVQTVESGSVYPCDGGQPIGLTAADVAEGVSLQQLARCADALHGRGTYDIHFIDAETGVVRQTIEVSEALQFSEGVSDSGMVAGVVANFGEDDASCDGLIDIPEAGDRPVVIWDGESEQVRDVALPEEIGEFNGWARSYVRGDSLIVFAAGQAWMLDLTSLEWTKGPQIGHSVDAQYVVSEDGSTIFSVAFTNDVVVTDVSSQVSRTVETDLRGQIYWFAYADHDIALVEMPTGTFRIDLGAE